MCVVCSNDVYPTRFGNVWLTDLESQGEPKRFRFNLRKPKNITRNHLYNMLPSCTNKCTNLGAKPGQCRQGAQTVIVQFPQKSTYLWKMRWARGECTQFLHQVPIFAPADWGHLRVRMGDGQLRYKLSLTIERTHAHHTIFGDALQYGWCQAIQIGDIWG